jgi:hypothetical protein
MKALLEEDREIEVVGETWGTAALAQGPCH